MWGSLSDRFARRKVFLLIGFVGSGIALFAMAVSGNMSQFYLANLLAGFLGAVNSAAGGLESAKCDVWWSAELNPEEEIFGASQKFGGYVDLLFSNESARVSFHECESFAKRVVELLKAVPEIPAAAELLIRRCFRHETDETREGFYITCYVFGYGDDESQARQRWAIGLELVANAIRQVEAGIIDTLRSR